eukprot:5485460-Pyramimonas_sp.AAC.3
MVRVSDPCGIACVRQMHIQCSIQWVGELPRGRRPGIQRFHSWRAEGSHARRGAPEDPRDEWSDGDGDRPDDAGHGGASSSTSGKRRVQTPPPPPRARSARTSSAKVTVARRAFRSAAEVMTVLIVI